MMKRTYLLFLGCGAIVAASCGEPGAGEPAGAGATSGIGASTGAGAAASGVGGSVGASAGTTGTGGTVGVGAMGGSVGVGAGGATGGSGAASGGMGGTVAGSAGLGGAGASGTGGMGGAGGTGMIVGDAELIIQEDELGFNAIDGLVLPREGSTSITGFTGTGFADGDIGYGKTISWSVRAEQAGTYGLVWRYAFGGAEANLRDGQLVINGRVIADTVVFPYTTDWSTWQETEVLLVPLAGGPNFIQLRAIQPSGMANFDYIKVIGDGVSPDSPSFSLTVDQNDPLGGSVSYAPVEGFYAQGSSVTLTAVANAGYFFQSWSGEVPSADAEHTFSITQNTHATAIFLPNGTAQDPALVGYAAVQDDAGTPYIVTGGSLGSSVTASSLAELKTYLERPEPTVVSFSGLIQGTDVVHIASNKTLLGVGSTAHLMGIELEVAEQQNVIIRNVAVSHVVAEGAGEANDAIVLSGAKNVWIDHCELYSDLDNGKDYYDGLLEIKNGASFITVSWTHVHDHYKASLVSSGDEQVGDSVVRVTYHHNYFQNIGSRMPSIRFGRAHIFNNYYRDNDFGTCVNSRMGAVVRVENNYFENSQDLIGSWDSPTVGTWDVSNNTFVNCSGAQPTTSTGSLTIPYAYSPDAPASLPTSVPAGAGVGKL